MEKMTAIELNFPGYKLKAIEQSLREKDNQKTIEELLKEHMDGLYQKHVPTQAQKYLDALLGEGPQEFAESSEKQAASEQKKSARKPYVKRTQAADGQAQAPASPGESLSTESPEPEPAQEMSMGI